MTGWKSVTTGDNSSGEIGVITKAERLWGLGGPSQVIFLYLINTECDHTDWTLSVGRHFSDHLTQPLH